MGKLVYSTSVSLDGLVETSGRWSHFRRAKLSLQRDRSSERFASPSDAPGPPGRDLRMQPAQVLPTRFGHELFGGPLPVVGRRCAPLPR